MLSFVCQKNSLSFSIPAGLEVLCMEEPDDDFFRFILLNLLASLIIALLVPVHFMFIQKNFVEGFVSKKNFSRYSLAETPLAMRRLCGISKSYFWIYYCQIWVVPRRKCTKEPQFYLINMVI